jgi:hypothetical protein
MARRRKMNTQLALKRKNRTHPATLPPPPPSPSCVPRPWTADKMRKRQSKDQASPSRFPRRNGLQHPFKVPGCLTDGWMPRRHTHSGLLWNHLHFPRLPPALPSVPLALRLDLGCWIPSREAPRRSRLLPQLRLTPMRGRHALHRVKTPNRPVPIARIPPPRCRHKHRWVLPVPRSRS